MLPLAASRHRLTDLTCWSTGLCHTFGSVPFWGRFDTYKGGVRVGGCDGRAYYLLQYIYFPCKKFDIENKKNYDGVKIAGKLILVFFNFFGLFTWDFF